MSTRSLEAGGPHRILWMSDLSPRAAACGPMVRWLAGLSTASGDPAEVVVACGLGTEDGDEARAHRQQALGEIAALAGDLESVGVAARPVVARTGALELARTLIDEHDIDLVVCGRHGHGGLTRALMGSTARRFLRELGLPVLVVHHGEALAPRRLLCPIELEPLDADAPSLTEVSARGLRVAAALARRSGARLTVAWVAASPGPFAEEGPDARQQLDAETRRILLETPEGEAGLSWGSRLVRSEDVVASLVDTARQADLVVLGTAGRRGLQRLGAQSVAEALLEHAPSHVLVAR